MRKQAANSGHTAREARVVRIAIGRTGLIVDTCGATRLLVPGFLIGLSVSSVAGSDLLGWIAGAVTVAVLIVVQRFRGTGSACAIHLPEGPTHDGVSSSEPAHTPTSPN